MAGVRGGGWGESGGYRARLCAVGEVGRPIVGPTPLVAIFSSRLEAPRPLPEPLSPPPLVMQCNMTAYLSHRSGGRALKAGRARRPRVRRGASETRHTFHTHPLFSHTGLYLSFCNHALPRVLPDPILGHRAPPGGRPGPRRLSGRVQLRHRHQHRKRSRLRPGLQRLCALLIGHMQEHGGLVPVHRPHFWQVQMRVMVVLTGMGTGVVSKL